MSLSLPEIAGLVRAIVAERYADRVEIYGFTRNEEDSARVDVAMMIAPARQGDRRRKHRTVVATVRASDRDVLEQDLADRLALALRGPGLQCESA